MLLSSIKCSSSRTRDRRAAPGNSQNIDTSSGSIISNGRCTTSPPKTAVSPCEVRAMAAWSMLWPGVGRKRNPSSTSPPSTSMRRTRPAASTGAMLSSNTPATGVRAGSPMPAAARSAAVRASSPAARAAPYRRSRPEHKTVAFGKVGTQWPFSIRCSNPRDRRERG